MSADIKMCLFLVFGDTNSFVFFHEIHGSVELAEVNTYYLCVAFFMIFSMFPTI